MIEPAWRESMPRGESVQPLEKVTTKKLAIYTGRTHRDLATEVAAHLGVQLGDAGIVEFSNGEIRPRFGESVRGRPHTGQTPSPSSGSPGRRVKRV